MSAVPASGLEQFPIPTGYLFVDDYSNGRLETPSMDEEDGLVTCDNAVLGGGCLKTDSSVIRIEGIGHTGGPVV